MPLAGVLPASRLILWPRPRYRTRDALGGPEDPVCKSPFLLSWGVLSAILRI